jgi:DNA-binding Lrp family transcriptional regulator
MPDTIPCPRCGAPARITKRFRLGSADGSVEHLKTGCVNNHWLTPLAEVVDRERPAALDRDLAAPPTRPDPALRGPGHGGQGHRGAKQQGWWAARPGCHPATDPPMRPLGRRTAVRAATCSPDPPPHATIPSAPVSTGRRGRQDARRWVPVVTAYILIQTEVGKAAQVARDIVEIKGVQQAEDLAGPYDVIVRAEARNLDELGRLVVARVQAVDGITRTLTCPVVHL